ncbi:thioredoxin family protein [Candidatus Woesearchaeota archaeon]|nr:thioredoxin family protein [Candidatus Woesearchaeota archaeon]
MEIGNKAPNFRLKGVDNKDYTLDSFKSKKALVIIFSCNHCPYVRAYEDRLIDIQMEYKDKGVQLIAINSNDDNAYPEDSFENMKLKSKQKKFNFPYLRDESQETAKSYSAERTPHIFVFDKDRILRYTGRIDDNWQDPDKVSKQDLREALDLLIKGKEVKNPITHVIGCTIKWKQ